MRLCLVLTAVLALAQPIPAKDLENPIWWIEQAQRVAASVSKETGGQGGLRNVADSFALLGECELRLLRAQKREELRFVGLLGQRLLEAQNVRQPHRPLGLGDDHLAGGGRRLQQPERIERFCPERGCRRPAGA